MTNEKEWIGKLVWFYDVANSDEFLGKLCGFDESLPFPCYNGNDWYRYCRPVKHDEVEFVE